MATARIINPPCELYLDSIFFLKEAEKSTNQFLKWRYFRVCLLTTFCSLEAAININKYISTEKKGGLDVKWKDKFTLDSPEDKKYWDLFLELKKVREAIEHYTTAEAKTKDMYETLETRANAYLETARFMLVRIYGEKTIFEWEKNATPVDLSDKNF